LPYEAAPADGGKPRFFEQLSNVALMVVDAEALADGALEVQPPPAHHGIDFAVGTGLHEPGGVGHLVR